MLDLLIGDIMGNALSNLNCLVRLPTGCGEQNMITLAPLIAVLQYLETTGQLNADIRQTATDYIQKGVHEQIHIEWHDIRTSVFSLNLDTWTSPVCML